MQVSDFSACFEKLLLFACLVSSRTLCQTVYKFQASSFDELSFFPRAGLLCLVKCDEGRFSGSVLTGWKESPFYSVTSTSPKVIFSTPKKFFRKENKKTLINYSLLNYTVS